MYRTRIVLKPGFWDENQNDELKSFALHLGHLGNLYRNYELVDLNNNSNEINNVKSVKDYVLDSDINKTEKYNDGLCLVLIDDSHKTDSEHENNLLRNFIDDLKWLGLPKLKICPITANSHY